MSCVPLVDSLNILIALHRWIYVFILYYMYMLIHLNVEEDNNDL